LVLLIERYVSDLDANPVSAAAALGVASPSPDRASPAGLARYVRGHRGIESLHWLRDTLYQQDKSQVRTRSGPRIMAAMRYLAISACTWPDAPTSPKPPDGPAGPWTGHLPSSASPNDLERPGGQFESASRPGLLFGTSLTLSIPATCPQQSGGSRLKGADEFRVFVV
jgi:hypothetical protein